MITISLDEQGNFENFNAEDKQTPLFIAGVIYDDKGIITDSFNERTRIVNFLKEVCISVGKKFPRDMHCNNYVPGKNAKNVAIVKKAITKALPEFIKSGTFNGKEVLTEGVFGAQAKRQGKYYIFVELKSSEGKTSLLGKDVSNFIKDGYAGNLYVHMAESVVERCIFHNPILKINDVSLSLATRSVVVDEGNIDEQNKYSFLGYKPLIFSNENMKDKVYQLTNPDFYRTAIAKEMIENDRADLDIKGFDVVSIEYKASQANEMAFLYLADIICSILGFDLEGSTPEEWLIEMSEKSADIVGKEESLIFLYDVIDEYYKNALVAFEEGDLYKSLSIAFDGLQCESEYKEYYAERWFLILLEKIKAVDSCSEYTMAIRKFREAAHNNNLDQDKLLFICELLSAMENTVIFPSEEDRAILYDLYDTAAAALNHCGESGKARVYLNKAKEYIYYFPLEKYLDSLNKEVVSCCDQLKFDEAKQLAEKNLDEWEKIYSIRKELLGQGLNAGLNIKKAMSQLAQVYAFSNDGRAMGLFERALKDSTYNDPNDLIILSYYLHYLIQINDREAYERYIDKFLEGSKDIYSQFEYIIKRGGVKKDSRFSMEFALYIYIKAIYQFYISKLPEKLIRRLSDIEKSIDKIIPGGSEMIDGHPWEIIYKYLAMIMHRYDNQDKEKEYLRKIDEVIGQSGGILNAISLNGYREYYDMIGDIDNRSKYEHKLFDKICEINSEISKSVADEKDVVEKYITYMYR